MTLNIDSTDKEELKTFFDPTIYKNLNLLTLNGIEWKRLTIIFWDISGFSKLCNDLRDNQNLIVAFLKEYFTLADQVIRHHRGIIDKYIGDGVLAFFGYPEDNLNTPSDAVNAALELRSKFKEIKKRYEEYWLKYYGKKIIVNLKCGIHTGSVLFGLIESNGRSQITAVGTNVNLTSRLEGLANHDQIIISEELKNIIENEFITETREITQQERLHEFKSFNDIEKVFILYEKHDMKNDSEKILDLSTSPIKIRYLSRSELEQFPFKEFQFKISSYFSSIKLTDFDVQHSKNTINVEFNISGTIVKGFVDALFVDSKGNEYWYPDSNTYDMVNQIGNLTLNNQVYPCPLRFELSEKFYKQFRLFIFIFEDKDGNRFDVRKIASGIEIKL